MRTASCRFAGLAVWGAAFLLSACGGSRPPKGVGEVQPPTRNEGGPRVVQPSPPPPVLRRALPGDTVVVTEYAVLASKQQQFEEFLSGSYWPALQQLAQSDSVAKRLLQSARVLRPLRPAENGTFTYVILFDPVVPGEYSIRGILRRVYPADEAARFARLTGSLYQGRLPAALVFVQTPSGDRQ